MKNSVLEISESIGAFRGELGAKFILKMGFHSVGVASAVTIRVLNSNNEAKTSGDL